MERTEAITLTNMCMIMDESGRVVVENKKTANGYGLILPGGHVEHHEAIADSMVREIFEETGLRIANIQLCGIKDWIEENGSRYMVFLYRASTFTGELKSSSEGEVFWMPLEELKNSETLWHLDKMLEIFCGTGFTELYCDKVVQMKEPKLI